jgi:hypothetical protein
MTARTERRAGTTEYASNDFVSPRAFAAFLVRLGNKSLRDLLGAEGARRIRQGHVTLCDVVIGAIRLGLNPLDLFDAVDVAQCKSDKLDHRHIEGL